VPNVDAILQSNTGSFSASSGSATLPAGTQAGSAVLLAVAVAAANVTTDDWAIVGPTGFVQWVGESLNFMGQSAAQQWTKPYLFVKVNTSGETSWTINVEKNSAPGAGQVTWAALEVVGIGLDPNTQGSDPGNNPRGVFTPNVTGSNSSVGTRSTGTAPGTTCYDSLAIGVWAALSTTTTPPTISGHTNGFAEIASVTQIGATRALTMSVGVKPLLVVGSFESTATISASAPASAGVCALYGDGAKFAPIIDVMAGFEWGTVNGLATGSELYGTANSTAPFDYFTGTPQIVTTHPRTGTYGLRLVGTSSIQNVGWTNPGVLFNFGPSSEFPVIKRLHFYFPTLPAGDVPLYSIEAGSLANGMVVWYRSASQKFGIKIGTGTEQTSDAVVSATTHIGLDLRYDPRTTTHVTDWAMDYDSLDTTAPPVLQTRASASGMTVTDVSNVRIGWHDARTCDVFIDDVVLSKWWGTFPLGDYRIRLQKPTGTPTLSGTTTNFKTFTTNGGTLTTWAAPATVTNLSEVPPVVGASANGLTQVSTAANDYVQVPMESFTAAPDYLLRAIRWYIAGWAASGTAATSGAKFYDGTLLTDADILVGDHGFDNAATVWLCRMHRSSSDALGNVIGFYQLTQARLDALAVRLGYSTDAAPDEGWIGVYAELAYQPATVYNVTTIEGGFTVDVRQDPVSGAVASYLATVPAGGRGGTLTWTVNAVDGSQYVTPDPAVPATYVKVIGADDIAGLTAVGFTPDPE
jgi:hypothetical protein